MQKNEQLFILSPFEIPDVRLALETIKAGAFPILHLGRDKNEADNALKTLSSKTKEPFGVCIVSEETAKLELPINVTKVIVPFGLDVSVRQDVEVLYQVHSFDEANEAINKKVGSIILKGNEGAGRVANKSSFLFFQGVTKNHPSTDTNIYIQGGAGVHSSSAYIALGAKGVIFDSQVVLFPECTAPKEIKEVSKRLSGSETILVDNFRVLRRSNSPALAEGTTQGDLLPYLGGFNLAKNYLPMGQDIALSVDFKEKYSRLGTLVNSFKQSVYGHLIQAKKLNILSPNNSLAQDLDIKYPIAQGPMARVSDVPQFAKNIADEGALPFVAMSLMQGKSAQELINSTAELVGDKPWGVGILGFTLPKIREEQTQYILNAKPSAVLIAGGRPSLAKPFEDAGIKTFLHVPSSALLDMFLKEGARNFIFEGRESGGHVGPLYSMILWEKQIFRILKENDKTDIRVFFAGGIHDSFSAAFVSIMSATLAAQGIKIGVLMGTSYLFTKEIVESGAILEEYQKQLLKGGETVLLESAPGQETRSIKSPFTEYFTKEKERLRSENTETIEMLYQLEKMNLGRSRIAAKGVEREGDELLELDKQEQFERGLYMTGQATMLKNKIITIAELHTETTEKATDIISKLKDIDSPKIKQKSSLDIAIVGMECIFPDAKNKDEYWRNILLGKNSITEVPDSRWNKEIFYDPNTRDTDFISSKWGGFIPTIDFDPLEFGIPPQSLASIEPVQLLSLYVAKRALVDAGYSNLEDLELDTTSVIFGAEGATELASSYGMRAGFKQLFGQIPDEVKKSLPRLNEDSFAGVLSNVISGRIANRLNLGGRNYTVDAACGSSLAALDLGCQELYSERSDMVILGGADFHNGLTDYLMFSCTHALSRKGYSASFDANADGIALGEGIAVLVLKRLEDAERDGNKIYSVIKGMGGSSDGKSLGMTAPNKKGQIRALERAYQSAGILPSDVQLVEAHGTGTVVGDRTELSALTDMFLESGAIPGQAHLGSVKAQIGHTKCAAGLAGVIKAALSSYYSIKPPTINLTKPNSFYNSQTSPFRFNTQSGLWNSEKRIAGISAFGFGGTNFHAILENYETQSPATTAMPTWPAELFVFRGNDISEAQEQIRKVKHLLAVNKDLRLKDLAFSLAGYNDKNIQVAIVSESVEDLLERMNTVLEEKNDANVYITNPKEGKVAFLFSGQGSQRVNMARDLFVTFPAMRELLLQNPEYEKIIFPETVFSEEALKAQQQQITDTRNAQPLLGIVDMAIANFLRSLDIEPDMVAGHSYGELPALCFAGVFSSDKLVSLSKSRALSILESVEDDKGKMAAISLSEEEVEELLKDETEVWAVNYNSKKQIVLAGTTTGMQSFMQKMAEKGIACKEINVACAFHSPLLSKAKEIYAEVLKDVPFESSKLAVWSNTTAELYPENGEEIKERLTEHLIKPVLFTRQVEKMYDEGARVFIEAGPGRVLVGLVHATLGNEVTTIQTEGKGYESISFMLKALAKYISTGRNININKLFEDRNAVVLDIDNPEQYTKKSTIWHINGHFAAPSVGEMPAHGAYPITNSFVLSNTIMSNITADQIMLEYLQSMKATVQSQRDVMLGYLGQAQISINSPALSNVALPQWQGGNDHIISVNHPSQEQLNGVTGEADNLIQFTSYTKEQIKTLMLEVVSEKTGYPVEMLGVDLDLEADLSIDSIKRMEIIGALREKFNITGGIEESEDAIEKMATIKTLQEMMTWFEELTDGDLTVATTATDSNEKSAIKEAKVIEEEISVDENLCRLRFDLLPYSIRADKDLSVKDAHFAVTDDGQTAIANSIKDILEAEGAIVDIVTSDADLNKYDGLVIINSFKSDMYYKVNDVFNMIKSTDTERIKWICVLSDVVAHVDAQQKVDGYEVLKSIQGFSGLIKSLAYEYKNIAFRSLAFHTYFDSETISQIVLDELSKSDKLSEVVYKGRERFKISAIPEPLQIGGDSDLQLDENSVVIVSGGAQGITTSLVEKMASEFPCTYVLLGRSPHPDVDAVSYTQLMTKEKIRQYLIVEEQMKVPIEIEKHTQSIYKSNQILATISKIEEAGGKAIYESLDITDEVALTQLLGKVKEQYGKIDGIIHAAGVLDDKMFDKKTLESFEHVYTTKVSPLNTLLNQISDDLKFMVMFSSISAALGNAGQTDYSAANSVFDLTAFTLNDKTKTRVLSINWGPWKGAGMVSNLLEDEFKKRGVAMIPLKEGSEYFVNELKYGKDSNVLLMAGEKDIINFLDLSEK